LANLRLSATTIGVTRMSDAHQTDDNPRIIELIKIAMGKGVKEYGHGLRHGDDTTQWGTEDDSWVEMALEEALDLSVYLATQLIRIEEARKRNK